MAIITKHFKSTKGKKPLICFSVAEIRNTLQRQVVAWVIFQHTFSHLTIVIQTMSSTGFNIGLTTEKSSSRVLRPPGGGHSDIFGVRDNQNELITPSKKRNHPQSTIGSCFTMENVAEKQPKPKEDQDTTNGVELIKEEEEEKNEVDNGIDENKAPGEDAEEKETEKKEEPSIAAPRRGRVPPGGFSTGLW